MNPKPFSKRRGMTVKRRRRNKFNYRVFMVACILFILQFIFLQHKTIGHDHRYSLYILILPVLIGTISLAFYEKDFLLRNLSETKKFYQKTIVVAFFLIQGIFTSIILFFSITNASWNYLNKKEAEKNPHERIQCQVARFLEAKNPEIGFYFQNRYERIYVSRSVINSYSENDAAKYLIELDIQKGIWNHYVVKSWEIKENTKGRTQ